MDTPVNDQLFNRDFLQTRITRLVAKGLRVTPYMNKDKVVNADQYVFYQEKATPEEDLTSGLSKGAQKIAPGAELEIVRTSGMKGESIPVETRGFKLVIDITKLKQNGQSILNFITKHAYFVGRDIETDVVNALKNGGTASTATLSDGVWETSSSINLDIRRMKVAYHDDSLPMELNTFCLDETNFTELCDYKEAMTGKDYDFPEFDDGPNRFMYGGQRMTHGTCIGFDRTMPPATVAYDVNPNAFNPSVLKGMEGYAPFINVKVKEILDEDPEKLIIFMRATTAVALEEPRGAQVQTGL
jgi:hypothetical protein